MSLSLKEYYSAVDILRTVDGKFEEQYFESKDGRPPYLYASLERSVSHDLVPSTTAKFAELAVLVGGFLSMFVFPKHCNIRICVSADILTTERN